MLTFLLHGEKLFSQAAWNTFFRDLFKEKNSKTCIYWLAIGRGGQRIKQPSNLKETKTFIDMGHFSFQFVEKGWDFF